MLNFLILAAHSEPAASTGKSMSWSWGIVLLGLVFGLAISLIPARRTYEVKKPKDE